MWKTVVPALSVLAAEAVIRRKINALPPETFPLRIGRRVQLRRAYNRGLLCSKLADRPKAAAALQTASAAVLAAMAAAVKFLLAFNFLVSHLILPGEERRAFPPV